MTPDEVREYLGFPEGVQVVTRITDGMRDVPYPHTDQEHVEAFRAFLACAGQAPLVVRES